MNVWDDSETSDMPNTGHAPEFTDTPARTSDDHASVDFPGYIVGIGASAGGLEALEYFFDHLPNDSGLGFVVVQHLSPDFKSLMVELLSRHTSLQVHRVEDGAVVRPNAVYLIPPKKNLLIAKGRLRLVDQDVRRGLNLPIDVFFRSLAKDVGSRAIGVILSGTGSDGTEGIRAIKEAGGMVMVQDEHSAKFDGMPRSAKATGLADYVLTPDQMPIELINYVRYPSMDERDGDAGRLRTDETVIREILHVLRDSLGLDFVQYKESMLSRRIERRMIIRQAQSAEDYLELVKTSAEEQRVLYHEFLIGVTKFFRDSKAFEQLSLVAIPDILQRHDEAETIRVWVTACSTGEEAYSVAILFREQMERLGIQRDIKIFATDVDERSIAFASQGKYPENIAADVSAERLEKFFARRGSTFEVLPSIRKMVIFAPHNLLEDSPFTKMDLICCRNLLIYLRPELQKRLIALFHLALADDGSLLLGASETIGELGHAFLDLDRKWKIYRRKRGTRLHHEARWPRLPAVDGRRVGLMRVRETPVPREDTTLNDAYKQLIHHYAPPSLLLDGDEVIYVFGDAGRFLKAPTGWITSNIHKLVHEDLAMILATSIHRALTENEEVTYTSVRLQTPEGTKQAKIYVRPFRTRDHENPLLLVSFADDQAVTPEGQGAVSFDASDIARQRIDDLENELNQTRENLQATIEELESSNEELQATNEELLASNEELQSTNEELHSVNEELFTVNAEHQEKIRELTELNNDLDNLYHSTNIATLFLDRELRVRKFTPDLTEIIYLLDQDIGRPIAHISHHMKSIDLVTDASQVLETGLSLEKRVQDEQGLWYLMRVMPYRVDGDFGNGVVISFVEISAVVQSERALRRSRQFLRDTIDSLPQHIAILDATGEIVEVNDAWRRFATVNSLNGVDCGVGSNYLTICRGAEGAYSEEALLVAEGIEEVRDGKRESFSLEYPCHSPTEKRFFLLRVTRFVQAGEPRLVVSHDNITNRVLAEQETRDYARKLEESQAKVEIQSIELQKRAAEFAKRNDELARRNRQLDDFAYIASHDLKEPLQGLRLLANMLAKNHAESLDRDAKEKLLLLEQQAHRLDDLVEALLNFSRVARMKGTAGAVDLEAVTDGVLARLEPLIHEAGVLVQRPRPLPDEVCDELVSEVFANLVSNATKYNDKEEKWIEIGYEEPAGENSASSRTYYVRDNGIGLKPQQQEAIFEIFRRLHPPNKFGGGVGAGLAIAKRIVESHGGKIWVESNPGIGSTFYFTLGARETDANDGSSGDPDR